MMLSMTPRAMRFRFYTTPSDEVLLDHRMVGCTALVSTDTRRLPWVQGLNHMDSITE